MKIISLFKYLTNNIPSSFCCFKTLEIIRLHDKINSRPQNYSILFYTSYKISEILKDTFLRILHTRARTIYNTKKIYFPPTRRRLNRISPGWDVCARADMARKLVTSSVISRSTMVHASSAGELARSLGYQTFRLSNPAIHLIPYASINIDPSRAKPSPPPRQPP